MLTSILLTAGFALMGAGIGAGLVAIGAGLGVGGCPVCSSNLLAYCIERRWHRLLLRQNELGLALGQSLSFEQKRN